jgi:hypothetical protein
MNKPWRPKKIGFKSGSSDNCRIWNLGFKTEDDKRYVKLLDGLINNISAKNLNEWVEIQETGFLILNISSSAGSISEFSLEFSSTMPSPIGDEENLPPSQFGLFLGKISNYAVICKFTKALSIQPFRSRWIGVTPSSPAENNFVNFYTWAINEI